MLKTKGTITYTTKENPDQPITEEVLSAYQQAGTYQVNIKLPAKYRYPYFLYYGYSKKWMVPDKEDKYGDLLYKEFDGKIISFEYTTYWEED